MNRKANGILCGILFVTLLFSGCKSSQIITNKEDMVETDEQGLIVFDEEEADEELKSVEEDEVEQQYSIGISFPDVISEEAVVLESKLIKKNFLEQGYTVVGMDTVSNTEEQIAQIRSMIRSDVDAIVVDPVDVYSLTEVLKLAEEKGIPVFAYRDLIMDSNAVTYLITFNYRTVGQSVATKIIEEFGLDKMKESGETLTIEFFMGDCSNQNDVFFFHGLKEVLMPYIEAGVLIVPSEKTAMKYNSVVENGVFSETQIQKRLEMFEMNGDYPNIICCSSDIYCQSVIAYLEQHGLEPEMKEANLNLKEYHSKDEEWPYITGLGCQKESVIDISDHKQAFSLFMDERLLVEECIKDVAAYLSDAELEVSDYGTYDNGIRIVGAMLSQVQLIDADNYPILIDNGYYTDDDLTEGITNLMQ